MIDQPPDSIGSLAARLGVDPPLSIDQGIDWALPIITSLRDRGMNILLKVDGERSADTATVVVSGPLLEDEFIRRDGPTLGAALAAALTELGRRGWD